MREPRRRRPPPPPRFASLRRGTVRLPAEVAVRVRAGHPWIFRDALGRRALPEPAGAIVEVVDSQGGFLGRALYDPEGAIALRVVTRQPGETVDIGYLRDRLRAAQRRRERLVDLAELTALRLFSGESEGFPGVAVDRYGEFLVAQMLTPAALCFADALYDAAMEVYAPRGIYEQRRLKPLAGEGPRPGAVKVRGEIAPVEMEVREGSARFGVDVSAPQSVGLFPDLREGRQLVRRLARGARVLNLFSYTGGFTVAAAQGGAGEVVSVDLQAKNHARARHNLERSGRDPEAGQEFLADDAFKVLARLASRGRRFDLVICDPPSFAQAKGRVFTALKDWAELVQGALEVLEPGGLLLCCSNTVKLGPDELERALGEGAARARTRLVVVSRRGLPPDFPVAAGFPEGHYLKVVLAARE